MTATDEVAICIPTYEAETFIERTLDCACAQTHTQIRIHVSVDRCDDRTAEICVARAHTDERMEIAVQQERLGWSQNANAALDQADSPFFFLYFHDDVIDPRYVEILLRTLRDHREAASAHCDLVEFGLSDDLRRAHTYSGTPFHRLVDFMTTKRGATLRSLVRRDAFSTPLRFPRIHGDSHWVAYAFHMTLLGAGPAIGVHQSLYKRWQRDGSLTRSTPWTNAKIEGLLRGYRESRDYCLALIERTLSDVPERRLATYILDLSQRLSVARHITQKGDDMHGDLLLPTALAGGLDEIAGAKDLLTVEAVDWIRRSEDSLRNLQKVFVTQSDLAT